MKVINKFLVTMILLLITACSINRINLKDPIDISYHTQDVSMEIILSSKKIINNKNFYFGDLRSQLLSKKRPKEIILIYKDQKSEIYNDSNVSSVGLWRRSHWNADGVRTNKIYVVFDADDIKSDDIKIITKDVPEDIAEYCSHEKSATCDKFNKMKKEAEKK